ncbi:putative PTH11-type G-protein coupled receptor protein [Ilyonectria destructans]|nr:putative PTH11-type G-protein coupled receptor protein [Ilyonectria destructans]
MKAMQKLGLALCIASASLAGAVSSEDALMAQMPEPSSIDAIKVNRLAAAVANLLCLPTNKTCTCADEGIEMDMTICTQMNCTIREFLIRDVSTQHIILSNTVGIIAYVCISQRKIFKLWWNLGLEIDDWCILLAGLTGIPSVVVNQYGTVPFDSITKFGLYFYIMVILYFTQITLLKITLVFFYLRIFPRTGVRRVLWGTIIFNALFGMVFAFVAILQCQPLHHFWDQFLKLSWRKKVGVGLMFFCWDFYVLLTRFDSATVVSIIRLQFLVKFGRSSQTWEYVEISRWSFIKISVGDICVCMPSLCVAIVRLAGDSENTGDESRGRTASHTMSDIHPPLARVEPLKITRERTYVVEYSEPDETELVYMRDFNHDKSELRI